MRWFGGYVGTDVHAARPRPIGARMLWEGLFPLWLVGHWPDHEVRTLRLDGRRIAVVGPCGAADISIVTASHVSDTVTAYPGAYTVIEAGHAGLVEKVTALRPGARVTLRPGHGPQVSPLRLIRSDCRQAAARRLRRALDGGVAVRVGPAHRPTSDLSGGLDSTSLCLLASRHVQPSGPVTAMTVHPAGQHAGGDLDYARAAARHSDGRIEHMLLALTAEHLPYAGLDRVPATDEPAPSTVTYARLAAQFALLADLGSDCHPTGDGGDTLLHPHPAYLADLAWSGRWLRPAAHSQGWVRCSGSARGRWHLVVCGVVAAQPLRQAG